MAKFEQILLERFRNILKRSSKNHKNSEMISFGMRLHLIVV